ncbi:UDP-4-amino-4,6-dideoxy-N-acetyl-beta-L-altrosamine N-acetyltransferase [Schinkia azotoformans]|uniref:UDP-4-amino-4, 6-dideoxy-N-acetyl-beta-L-altrosamine N-acetyltransferase n=1 Tax=Schinkia azotoformans TaxID=1454 RepID=UPI002E1D353C|nr:UDP-4-amino-4,6-dideoxy-N-acetyl-beta-L-altrosamine N-acetyltransferase [Schinkia azotoformans]MED4350945.1 UDP-4-amino-4,6-dideoxy-N-acetyl-beta-L-altrosamine N-acetyltransferase [Schinkia azotoformans]
MRFVRLKEEHLEQVLKWRTSEHVTRFMYTDVGYNLERQMQWYQQISNDSTCRYWIIYTKEQPIGLVSINDLDERNSRATWAYYIGDINFSMVGAMIGPYLYNYAFEKYKLHKLNGEVMAENINVRKIHQMHGSREVGFYKDHVFKNGQYHDVYIYEMLSEAWDKIKGKFKKYAGVFEE